MAERYKIVITIEDLPDGGVRCKAEPNITTLIDQTRQGPMAKSSAVAYAMAAMSKIAADSKAAKQKGQHPIIILPPATRGIKS